MRTTKIFPVFKDSPPTVAHGTISEIQGDSNKLQNDFLEEDETSNKNEELMILTFKSAVTAAD